jgi:hypothetical protein
VSPDPSCNGLTVLCELAEETIVTGSNLVVDFPPALYILAPSLGLNVLESSNATNANVYQQSNYELAGHMARIERSKQMAESQKGVGTDAITAIYRGYTRAS